MNDECLAVLVKYWAYSSAFLISLGILTIVYYSIISWRVRRYLMFRRIKKSRKDPEFGHIRDIE